MYDSHRSHGRRRRAYQASLLGGLTAVSLFISNAGAVHVGATQRAADLVAPGGPTTVGTGMAAYGAPTRNGAETDQAIPDAVDSFNATLPSGRRITPAGVSTYVGENPQNTVVTPDGKFVITTNDDERGVGGSNKDYSNATGHGAVAGGYTVSTINTSTMQVVSYTVASPNTSPSPAPKAPGLTGQTDAPNTGPGLVPLFYGLAVKGVSAPYTVYASGGSSDQVIVYSLDTNGTMTRVAAIKIPAPTDRTRPNYGMAMPAGLTLSPDGSRLYVVNDNGNNVVTIDTNANAVVGSPIDVGFFPYTSVLSPDGSKLYVSNWGVTQRNFNSTYINSETTDASGNITGVGSPNIGGVAGNLFANPVTDPARTSSVSVINLAGGNTAGADPAVSLAQPIDGINVVGGTHPSAMAVSRRYGLPVLYVADANEDKVAIIDLRNNQVRKMALPSPVSGLPRGAVLGLTPDAIAVSPRGTELYVAEAGINAVAVFNTVNPLNPFFIGYIPTGWYPTGVTVGPDNHTIYITNAKGVGSDYNYKGAVQNGNGVNLLFGTVQQVQLSYLALRQGIAQVRRNLYATPVNATANANVLNTIQSSGQPIQHVIFVLRENKTYDSYFGADATLNARVGSNGPGNPAFARWNPYIPNTKALAEQFNVGDNVYADSEESNAGHFFALAGTSTDYQQRTLLQRFNRPLLNIKNEDPEDYPLAGFIFNNALRNGVSYRDYGDLIRVSGYDDGQNPNPCADDLGYPNCTPQTYAYSNTTASTTGFGGLYAGDTPALAALGGHIDPNYPGWSLRISDQRRVKEFLRNVSRNGDGTGGIDPAKVPQFTFIWLPDDHTGSLAPAASNPSFEVSDNDAALGQLVDAVSHSAIWPNTAMFVTTDDGQGESDHVTPHRIYTTVVSPYAKRGVTVHRLSSTVSLPKTIEELLGLPAMNLGDLLANDLSDYFTTTPNNTPYTAIQQATVPAAAAETMRIAALTGYLNHSGPDQDTTRLGMLNTLFFQSEALAQKKPHMKHHAYRLAQRALYHQALAVLNNPHIPTNDYDG